MFRFGALASACRFPTAATAGWGVGLSVPFSDGCDRWFFPFLSSPRVVPRPSSLEVEGLVDDFEAVDAARAAVLRGVRFFLAERAWGDARMGRSLELAVGRDEQQSRCLAAPDARC
ncbi:MAG: hypothetical protein KY445_13430 [Armatimonadetes bacterium]|nr:hypothetical protein [Armatimonadota bacterium]